MTLCLTYSSFLLILISNSQTCIPPPGYERLPSSFDPEELFDQLQNHCQFDCNCPQTYLPPDPVCGTDSQTYPGLCALNCYACKFKKRIKIAYYGECDQEPL